MMRIMKNENDENIISININSMVFKSSIFILIILNALLLLSSDHYFFTQYTFSEGLQILMWIMFASNPASAVINLVCLLIIILFTIMYIKNSIFRKKYSAIREMYSALDNIARNHEIDTVDTFQQMNTIFEDMSLGKKRRYLSLFGALDHLLYYILKDEHYFKKNIIFATKDKATESRFNYIKDTLRKLIILVENELDYPELSASDKKLAKDIELSIVSRNVELGKSSLTSLLKSIQEKEQAIHKQKIESVSMKIWTIVGIVLTISFGVLGVLSFVLTINSTSCP